MTDKYHHISKKYDWETPQDLFDELDAEFNFNLDVCANHSNAKCDVYFTKELNGLRKNWWGTCWMNPPYGNQIYKWMAKAYQESQKGAMVICLIPSRTDTKWWHDFATKGEIRFLKGRLKFGNIDSPAPFPSAIVIFKGDNNV